MSTTAHGQCLAEWKSLGGPMGVEWGKVICTGEVWDPDGPGPRGNSLVIGGRFKNAGGKKANNIAAIDLQTGEWTSLGDGLDDMVLDLAVLPDGRLVAVGWFATVAKHVAVWNGTSWAPLGGGADKQVDAATIAGNGDLIIGGSMTSVGGVEVAHVARWDGDAWHAMGTGTNSSVQRLITLSSGEVLAGGHFTMVDGMESSRVAKWDGSAWHTMGNTLTDVSLGLCEMSDGSFLTCGWRGDSAGSPITVSRWNGADWEQFGNKINGKYPSLRTIIETDEGVFAGGWLPDGAGAEWSPSLIRWRPSGWAGWMLDGSVQELVRLPDTSLAIMGEFTSDNRGFGDGLVRRHEGTFSRMSDGLIAEADALIEHSDGSYIAGGAFEGMPANNLRGIARWRENRWEAIGRGLDGTVQSLVELHDGSIVAAGSFTVPDRDEIANLARWDGSSWHGFGGDVPELMVVELDGAGDLVIGGEFTEVGGKNADGVARWDGSTWHAMGDGLQGSVFDLERCKDGSLLAGGLFTASGDTQIMFVGRWDGTAWQPMGAGTAGFVRAVRECPNGRIFAGGDFGSMVEWDGSSWQPCAGKIEGSIRTIACTIAGVVAGGDFYKVGSTWLNNLAAWNDGEWSMLTYGTNGRVNSLSYGTAGTILAAGAFTLANSIHSPYASVWDPSPLVSITVQPPDVSALPETSIVIPVTVADGYKDITFRWYRNGVALKNGKAGAAPGGGMVVGAAGKLPEPATGNPLTLKINGAKAVDSGEFSVVFFNPCGASLESRKADVWIGCPSDFDRSGSVTASDFGLFIAAFEAGDVTADMDQTGFVDTDDFDAFVRAFELGC